MANLADHVFDACSRAVTSWPRGTAEVLELLAWMTDDDSEIHRAIEDWLQSEDRARIEVALEIEDWFPFPDRSEMEAVMAAIKTRWPDLAPTCERLVERRRALPEHESEIRAGSPAARLERLRTLLGRLKD